MSESLGYSGFNDSDDSEDFGFRASDHDRVWCGECKTRVWVEFTTQDGHLVQLPMPCGHEYDPDAVAPLPEPEPDERPRQVGPPKPCAADGCDELVPGGTRAELCRPCHAIHRKRNQREWRKRQAAKGRAS